MTTVSSGAVRVWVDGWQQECCGADWKLDSIVTWTVDAPDLEYLGPLFPAGSVGAIDWAEEHHSESSGDLRTVSGKVASIEGVHCDYAERVGVSDRMRYPVPGSARITRLTASSGDELRTPGFAGYLVTLEP